MTALEVANATLVASAASRALIDGMRSGNLGLSIGIAGFLIPYVVGAAYMLQELGIINSNTPLAGASSGALVATALCSGTTEQEFSHIVREIGAACRNKRNCQGSLDRVVRAALSAQLPPDAWKRCSGRVRLSITVGAFPPRAGGATRNLVASKFSSNEELIDAAAASSFIPLWSAGPDPRGDLTTRFNGRPAYDGFFSDAQPRPPLPLQGQPGYVIAISSNTPPWATAAVHELLQPLAAAATLNLAGFSGRGGQQKDGTLAYDSVVGDPCRTVEADAASAAREAAPGSEAAAGMRARRTIDRTAAINITAFRQAAEGGVDISPGIFHPTCIATTPWAEMVVLPADDRTNQHMLQLGRADALAWAQLTGLAGAAAGMRQPAQEILQG